MTATAPLEKLSETFRGSLIGPDHPEYEEARSVYNAMIDKRPALVARCADTADVMAAVRYARDNDLLLAIRGGSHNVAGLGTCDDGVVIDLSAINGVRVDPKNRTARVGGGCTWGDVDHATHPFGLAVPAGIISTTGVGGLTLGGGTGHLTRGWGLTCDNLISADVVTAEGEQVTASEKEHPDLFWALRGGGGNFGVVTSFEFQLQPAETVLGGVVFYPIGKTREVLQFYREFIAEAPRELSAFFAFQIGPPAPFVPEELQGETMCAIAACWNGDLKQGEKAVKPLREFGPPALDHLGPVPLPALNSAFDDLVPSGLQHYWKADFFNELSDEAIEAHVEHGPKVRNVSSTMHLYAIDGATQDVGVPDTAFAHREAKFSCVIAAMFPDPEDTDAQVSWVRNYWEALHPHSSGAAYVNFLMEEGDERIAASYGPNFERLVDVKTQYDPENVFRVNQNIRPK